MNVGIARNLPAQIVLELGSHIISGEIKPGSILTSDILESQFGVSRTVVREALKVLHDKGLTRARTKVGTIVLEREEWNLLDPDVISWLRDSSLPPQFLKDLEEVRSSYEPWVARMAAERRSDNDIEVLTNALKQMRAGYESEGLHSTRISDADMIFHQGLLNATQNDLIKRVGAIFIPLLRIRDDMVRKAIEDDEFIHEHEAVLAAVIAMDSVAAEAAMRKVLDTAEIVSAKVRLLPKKKE